MILSILHILLYTVHTCAVVLTPLLLCVCCLLSAPIPTLFLLPLPPLLPPPLPPSTGPDGGGEAAIPKGEDRVWAVVLHCRERPSSARQKKVLTAVLRLSLQMVSRVTNITAACHHGVVSCCPVFGRAGVEYIGIRSNMYGIQWNLSIRDTE